MPSPQSRHNLWLAGLASGLVLFGILVCHRPLVPVLGEIAVVASLVVVGALWDCWSNPPRQP